MRRVRVTRVCGVARCCCGERGSWRIRRSVWLSSAGRGRRSTSVAVARLFEKRLTLVKRRRRERPTLVIVRVVLSRVGRVRSVVRGIATLSSVSVFGGGIHGTVRRARKRASSMVCERAKSGLEGGCCRLV